MSQPPGEGEVLCPAKSSRMARERCVSLAHETGCSATCPVWERVQREHREWVRREKRDAERREVLLAAHREAYQKWGKKPPTGRRPGRAPTLPGQRKRKLEFWEKP